MGGGNDDEGQREQQEEQAGGGGTKRGTFMCSFLLVQTGHSIHVHVFSTSSCIGI